MLYSIVAITNFIAYTIDASAAAAIVFVIVSSFLLHFIFSLFRNPLTQSPIYHLSVAHIHSGFYPTYQSISEVKELVESQTTFISISLKIQNLAEKNAHPHTHTARRANVLILC